MCGRFANNQKIEQVAARFGTETPADDVQAQWKTSPNCGPMQALPIVLQYNDKRHVRLADWGFTPDWAKGKPIINAQSESAPRKATFREAFSSQRCIIPAIGYYEWLAEESGKQAYFIKPTDQSVFGFAGLWQTIRTESGAKRGQFVILTTAAADSIEHLHARMPVILSNVEEDLWLEETLGLADLEQMCVSYSSESLSFVTMDPAINSMRSQDWSLLADKLN